MTAVALSRTADGGELWKSTNCQTAGDALADCADCTEPRPLPPPPSPPPPTTTFVSSLLPPKSRVGVCVLRVRLVTAKSPPASSVFRSACVLSLFPHSVGRSLSFSFSLSGWLSVSLSLPYFLLFILSPILSSHGQMAMRRAGQQAGTPIDRKGQSRLARAMATGGLSIDTTTGQPLTTSLFLSFLLSFSLSCLPVLCFVFFCSFPPTLIALSYFSVSDLASHGRRTSNET